MSESEDISVGGAWVPKDNQAFPDDFSLDEAEFASELRDLFGPEREELPPLYTQTLLESAHIAPVGPGFEQKTAYRVFRRLSLSRAPLAQRRRFTPSWRIARTTQRPVSRPVALSFTAVVLFMVCTMVLASPAFGAGVRILLGQTGVQQVHGYPTHVRPSVAPTSGQPRAQLTTTMPISWLGETAGNYTYLGTQLLDPTVWSRGPIVDVQYTLTHPSAGTGVLDIREFQVNPQYSAVLQVVQDGSVTPAQVGNTSAVYVDGTWVPVPVRDRSAVNGGMNPLAAPSFTWESGIRSELIFERNGVVFWIVGDQRDGTGLDTLVSLAQNLAATSYSQLNSRWPERLRIVDEALIQSFQEPSGREVYHLVPSGASPDSASGVLVSSEP